MPFTLRPTGIWSRGIVPAPELTLRAVPSADPPRDTSQVGGPIILHVCGNCSDRLELFARSGVEAYHFEWQVDSKEAVRRIGDQVSLVGQRQQSQTLLQGTPEDVYKQARYAIEAVCTSSAPSAPSAQHAGSRTLELS